MREIQKTYKICRRVFQLLFIDINDIFFEYIQSLDLDEIQKMDDDIKSNGWGVKSLLEFENAFDFLRVFQMFYHFNGRFSLTNGLLVIPDEETPEGSKKVSLKDLYEMFQSTKSHGFVTLQFLEEIFLYQKMPSLSSIITFPMKRLVEVETSSLKQYQTLQQT